MARKEVFDALLFVDTNVLLDFYRIRKSDVSLKYIEQLEACRDRLILGSQVEMEYKKNRQRVIVESLNNFGTPDWARLTAPALVADLQAMKIVERKKAEISTQKNRVTEKIQRILSDPIHHDPVYQSLQRLFKHTSPCNLSRDNKERFAVRRNARKRFILGYPPRKQGDTSIGDAVNWEWIVECSRKTGKHVVVVTRDTDYGAIYNGKSYLNDWLKQEFSERVSKKRKIVLTEKLSQGLKLVHAAVTKEMEKEENLLLAELDRLCREGSVEG